MGIYINPYYWVDDHPLLYGNNGSLDPGTYPYYPYLYRSKFTLRDQRSHSGGWEMGAPDCLSRCISLHKNGDFPACHVSLPEGIIFCLHAVPLRSFKT